MSEYLIRAQFRGPPGCGNGGYVAGRAALLLGEGAVEATLRRPVPLDMPLAVAREAERVAISDAEGNLVMEARLTELALEMPAPPTPQQAATATRWFMGSGYSHSRGLCFCCGENQAEGFGLRVFSGRVEGRPGIAAALWRPDAAFAGADGLVAPEYLWTALDCPGQFAFTVDDRPAPSLLGRMVGQLHGRVAVGEACVVFGWQIAREGRKLHAGTAIIGADGGLRGMARALWITPPLSAPA